MTRLCKDIGDELKCCICHELLAGAHALPCGEFSFSEGKTLHLTVFLKNIKGHAYCGECIYEWFKSKRECPQCRVPCLTPTPVRMLDATILRVQMAQIQEKNSSSAQFFGFAFASIAFFPHNDAFLSRLQWSICHQTNSMITTSVKNDGRS